MFDNPQTFIHIATVGLFLAAWVFSHQLLKSWHRVNFVYRYIRENNIDPQKIQPIEEIRINEMLDSYQPLLASAVLASFMLAALFGFIRFVL